MKTPAEQVRESLEALSRSAGYAALEVLEYIEKLEEENARLTQSVKKLKLEAARRTASSDNMNSRLKDALRE
ncbi:hypothetical protein [Paenibacillus arenilitoris]|uniref:Uncharacterized protein n=1 Tax=Paenibacillus arenilitoris TaxID=2772299 RepID=A0A927CVR9_9BACL|nr:hypothetical protein [Paenibacillus arenilitoris]MBD2872726.1 hypothetical protein [Paenibacillus arenilitoris]